jgi:hypothetical protein
VTDTQTTPVTALPDRFFSGTHRDDLIARGQVMWLIERALARWDDSDPPRHVLSVLWGKVRDMKDHDTAEREQMDHEQHQGTVSA